MSKPYTAKTITGAQRRVRELEQLRKNMSRLLDRYDRERKMLAMLAADEPQLYSTIHIVEAKKIRDRILSLLSTKNAPSAGS